MSEIAPARVSLDVGDTLILPNDSHWYTVTGMEFLWFPVFKLTVDLRELDLGADEDEP